jgi:GntR family transcriptional regulator
MTGSRGIVHGVSSADPPSGRLSDQPPVGGVPLQSGDARDASLRDVSSWSPQLLDRRSSVPLYYQLQEILHQQIASGRFRVGDSLPSEGELCRMFDVSRIVVRQALEVLEDDGEIVRMQGKGTFVAEPKLDLAAGGLIRVLSSENPVVYDVEVLDAHFAAVEESVAARLGDASVLRIDWLLRLRGEPTAIAYSFLRPGALPVLERTAIRGARFGADTHIDLSAALDHPEISVSTSQCSPYNAERLGIPSRAPVFLVDVTEVARRGPSAGQAIEVARVIYRSDTLSLQLESTRAAGVHQIAARISGVSPA